VRKGYEYGKTMGSPLVGFFPEAVDRSYPTAETCEIANMIALAIKLSKAGVFDYWDDVEHYVRNQFAENQMLREDWLYRISESFLECPVEQNQRELETHRRHAFFAVDR
jgi:hypothetical protein